MKAGDIMTRRVITIDPDSTVGNAARRMLDDRIGGMPVVDEEGRIVGMLSEDELLHRAEIGTERHRSWWLRLLAKPSSYADEYVKSHGHKVRDVMTRQVVSVDENAPLAEVVRLMEKNHVTRLPVLRDGTLVGIVTRSNLMHALASAAEFTEPTADDRTLRERVLAAFESAPWAPQVRDTVVVKDGIVHLGGSVNFEWERQAMRVTAESVAGVKGVEDHIVVINPLADGAAAL
jgi:CBS domain-containing protein